MSEDKHAYASLDLDESIMPRHGPSAPPPPPDWRPPPYSEQIYDVVEPQQRHRWVFRLAMLEFLIGIAVLAIGITCTQFGDYCPYYTDIWSGALYILNAIFGVLAARTQSQNMFIAHLLTSTLCVICAAGAFCISYFLNFEPIGTDRHPTWHENYCVVFQHDTDRMHVMWTDKHREQYDFGQCVLQLKYGIAFHACTMVFAIIMAIINLWSAALCCCRTCFCARPCFVKP